MKQKTFHPLTATFIGAILETLPRHISSEHMQTWIQNPMTLQKTLIDVLAAPVVILDEKDKTYAGNLPMHIRKIDESTFDRHTAHFIAVIVQNIPGITNERMEMWIDNLNTLQKKLRNALTSDSIEIDLKNKSMRIIKKF